MPAKCVIHVAPPTGPDVDRLRQSYWAALQLTLRYGFRTVGLPCVGLAKDVGFNAEQAVHEGLHVLRQWMDELHSIGGLDGLDRLVLSCPQPLVYRAYKDLCHLYFPIEVRWWFGGPDEGGWVGPSRGALEGMGPGQAVGGGCQSGWGRLLSVPNATEAGAWRQRDSGWASAGRPGGEVPPPSHASLGPRPC